MTPMFGSWTQIFCLLDPVGCPLRRDPQGQEGAFP